MAVIVPGSIVNDIRGSVGTETYARNQGGLYVRARAGPAGPPTPEQDKSTAAMTALSQYWSGTLTEQQRNDWRSYAHQHPRPNRWGEPSIISGYNRFIATNFRTAIPAAAVNWDDAPPSPPTWPPICSFSGNAGTNNITIDLNPGNYDPPAVWLIIDAYWSPAVAAGINFFASPWTYAGQNLYVGGGVWINDPWVLAFPGGLLAGDRVFMKFIAQNAITGEFSAYYQNHCDIP